MAKLGTEHSRKRTYRTIGLVVALVLYLLLAYRGAWLSDDALISLRTANNFLQGYGLRWNVDERVQTYTHPLWLFALIGAHAVTGEPFYSSLYMSWFVSGGAVALLLFGCPGAPLSKLVGLATMVFSQAFMDFSSSGLENPLTHLLIILFVTVWVRCESERARLSMLSSVVACATLNRLDTALIFVPALLYEIFHKQRYKRLPSYLFATIPVAAWEFFSVLYYGFPFPNTAYAKLNQAQVATPLVDGLNYLHSSLLTDPITLCTIGCCIGFTLVRRDLKRFCLMGGAALYLAYVVRIGGDFMSGRFLSAPFCLCVACLAASDWFNGRRALIALVAVAVVGCLGRWPPPLTKPNYEQKPVARYIDRFGIHNERQMFFPIDSLANASRMNPLMPNHPWSSAGFALRAAAHRSKENRVRVIEAIGHTGYFAGPDVHLVDHWALSDALIARLPALFGKYGHYPRVIPDGYIETLATHDCHIADPSLAEYYKRLALVIRGPLWDPERLKTIWRLNTGAYQPALDRYAYVRGQQVVIQLQFTNPSAHACVSTYVWNDFRASAYELGCASERGKIYHIVWHVSPAGSTLVFPIGSSRTSNFTGLRKDGLFTVSVAFSDRSSGPTKELHELRYTYARVGDGLLVQRQPWPVWIQDFPTGSWHEGRAPGVLQVELTK